MSTKYCCICFDTTNEEGGGILCSSSQDDDIHFTCSECLTLYVETKCCFGDSDAANAQWKAREGNILCPMSSDCSTSCAHLTCKSQSFSTQQLARLLPETSFNNYIRSKEKYTEVVTFNKLVSEYGGVIKNSNQLLIDNIRRTNPDARQCPQCSHGPLTQSYCDDLLAHHGQVVGVQADGNPITISNNCPECGFLGDHWSAYPMWCVSGELSINLMHVFSSARSFTL